MSETNANDPAGTADFRPGASATTGDTAGFVQGAGLARVPVSVSVPGYEIEGVLGRGGMGVVYKARHLALKRTVALKMILAGGHAGPRATARFRIEAEAVARLQHPNIVQIHEVGEADGHPYCALEFVEGGTLAKKLAGKPMPATEAARLVETLARAMQLAHSRNVVHRDLKPANVLLTADGTPKITDFGLARHLDSDSGETQAGAVMGTPSYMAPEQASGLTHEAGAAADVYALGAILYECLTGRPPFLGQTVGETLDQVRLQEPVPPSRLQKSVPLDLETICLKCLRKEPERRYASAAELADELLRYQRGEPILARPVGRIESAWRWCRRNPGTALLSVGLVVALLVGFVVSLAFASKAASEATDARMARDRARASERLAYDRAYNSDLRLFQQMWEKNQFDFAHELLERQVPDVTDGIERRGFEWDYWNRQRSLSTLAFTGHSGPISCVAYSPDGKVIASGGQGDYAKRTWSVKLWDASTGREIQSLSGNGRRVTNIAFSPDGKRLALASDDLLAQVWDVGTGRLLLTLEGHTRFVRAVAYSPDGRHIATGGGDGSLRLWDALTGKERSSLQDARPSAINSLAFSPDSTRVAAGADDAGLHVWEIVTTKKLLALAGHRGPILTTAFSSDGKRLASGSVDGQARIWDADLGGNLHTLQVGTGAVSGVAFSTDGKRLATASDPAGVNLWDIATGQQLVSFKGQHGLALHVAFSPDGKHLASCDRKGTVAVWDESAATAAVFLSPDAPVKSLAIHWDGQRLIGGCENGLARVWDLETGTELRQFGKPPSLLRSIAIHPGGHQVVLQGTGLVLEVWDPRDGKRLHAEQFQTTDIHATAYCPDGTSFATTGFNGTIQIWSAVDFKPMRTFPCNGQGFGLAYDREGKLLALRDAEGVKVWEVATGRLMNEWADPTIFVGPVAFSPDGQHLASGTSQGIVTIWNRKSAKPIRRLTGHDGWVMGLAFSPDGKRLASGCNDRTVKVWDPVAGEELLTLPSGLGAVHCVAFSPCGKYLFAGADSGIRRWHGASP